jgi:peptidoglycan/LPS O-acetylase OafA/YrhL
MLALLTPGCMDSLGMGALLAVGEVACLKPGSTTVPRAAGIVGPGLSPAATLAGFALVAMLVTEGAGTTLPLPLMAIKQTLQAVVFGWIVLRASGGFNGVVGRFLSAKPIVYIGKISYGVYLAHGFAGEILATFGVVSASLPEPGRFLALCGITLAVASLSWHLMERPINALKASVPYTRQPHPRVVLA